MNPIEAAVAPLKADAIRRAEEFAREQVEYVRVALKKANDDLDVAAPQPSYSDPNYGVKYSTRVFFNNLVIGRSDRPHRPGTPLLVDVSPEYVEKIVVRARSDAAVAYDAFVQKLIGKIGPVTGASLYGNHVWGFSFLTVIKADGTREVWKTQTIINISKLGNPFLQWPTRKVKEKSHG